jgi:hypothetical protein
MNRAATLLIALALPAVAQTTTAPANSRPNTITVHTTQVTLDPATGTITSSGAPTTLTIAAPPSSCPVGFSAEPGVGPGMVIVVNGDTTASQKLKLQLSYLTDPQLHPSNIISAQITVHGLTAKGHIAPASSEPDDNTIAKQVDLALTIAPGRTASTAMLFQGFTSVRWITLDSLTYANGTTWHPAAHKSCSIVPNRYMAVADAVTTR